MPIDRTDTQAGRRGTAAPASRKRSQPVRTEPVAHERPPHPPKSPGELGPGRSWPPGGPDGNEILTTTAAVVLLVLLISEGITIVHMRGLLSAHMFIGLVLIPPVLLKLGSTGVRPSRCSLDAERSQTVRATRDGDPLTSAAPVRKSVASRGPFPRVTGIS